MPTDLIELFELDNLMQDILQHVLGIPHFGFELGGNSQDVSTLTHIVLKVLIRT